MNPMWNGGMPDAIPPPAGAVYSGQPEFHNAFPGYQQQQQQPHAQHPQQQQPPWWPATGQGTPWAHGGTPWPNTPAAGLSWANTPWQQQQHQFQQQTPAWAQPQMPRPGWGPAAQGGASPWGGHSGPSTPWDHWGEPPPQSAPASLGFSATAAPPLHESSSGQPVMGTSWFGPGMGSGMPGTHGQPRTDERWEGVDNPEWGEVREAWAHAQGQGGQPPAWAQGQDPRAAWEAEQAWAQEQAWAAQAQGPDPRTAWAHDPRAAWAHEGAPLERTHSWGAQGYKSPGKKKKKRSNSLGGGLQRGAWGTPAAFDENHLSRRPEDWRDDYSPRGSSGADIPFSSLFRKKSSAAQWAGDTKKRALAKVLEFNATRPHISYDLRHAPEETAYMGNFKPRSQAEMLQPAVSPIAQRMRLMHPRLPWYVDVEAPLTQPGVTLVDVIHTLFQELNRPIAGHDFWNEELRKREREGLTYTFKRRCGKRGEFSQEEMLKGVKRVDFLGEECIFVGLVRRSGMWEIKTNADHY
ncbi:hypothetical protein C8F04DRAFT_344271 [Mycena alexandri]|uniref:DUF6699 domain-containing protein n=1 Tax=Mycena alexandri TaxID=1745969 RepID=A0AAD6TM67_9AGAR|nr:hypothetical protein C8F04DRAFT_344271 [Mycena alexandri]